MPRPILKDRHKLYSNNLLDTAQSETRQKSSQMNKMEMDRILRKPRSQAYLNALQQLDAGGHVHNQEKIDAIINAIRNEFPDIELAGVLLGYVATCYLGKPYEVHTLDVIGNIIEHYQYGQTLPGALEKARSIAIRAEYEFIEVYVDCCRAISRNGTVSIIPL